MLEPLQADGVGTAVLQRAEELLEYPLVPLLVYRHRIPVVVLKNIGPMMPYVLSAHQMVTFGDCSGCSWWITLGGDRLHILRFCLAPLPCR